LEVDLKLETLIHFPNNVQTSLKRSSKQLLFHPSPQVPTATAAEALPPAASNADEPLPPAGQSTKDDAPKVTSHAAAREETVTGESQVNETPAGPDSMRSGLCG
jgi:hypothetical protein